MADDAPTTTRPVRKRVAPAKPAATSDTVTTTTEPPIVESVPVADTVTEAPVTEAPAALVIPARATKTPSETRIPLVYEYVGDSKSYSKWAPPEGCGVSGIVYAPKSTITVRVLIIMPTR